jgi:hypothetical protein
MSDTPDRLSPEVEAFLAPERRRPDPPADVQNAVFSRVAATLGWFGGGPGPGSGGPGGSPPPGGAPGTASALAKGSLAKTVATLIVGGVIGAGVHEAHDRATAEHANVAAVAPPAATSPPAAAPVTEPRPAPADANVVRVESPAPRAEHAARTEPRDRDRSLAAERALIEQARTALARDQGTSALAALDRHAREFPQGELEEERESLRVQALVGLGEPDQARRIGARFHRRFPRSIFGAVVDEALKSIP